MFFKKMINDILRLYKYPNLKDFDNSINYCGTYEQQSFLTRVFPIHKIFFGINTGCFFHDCRYSLLFSNEFKGVYRILFLKIVVDIIFYLEMLRFSFKEIKSLHLFFPRLLLSTIFFFIVLLFTPYYFYLFKKRQELQK